ncbi:homeodomain-interacting protein kinase 3-like isoform X1 [Xyrichtys novacula]|uniref:Homeodomain-interacting protein kinase 3-like isoform X1 n=1 Tax=Xyrichtys novacula TaxID=13765 RepID=A0AAV1H3H3_XYRNO|nr:homeodomain-interacting protein kinase 3-like isoform X1 [Xyrichtys novacula]
MAFDNNKTYELPKKYKYLKDLGEGSYGVVVQCLNTDTNKTVAIKIPKLKMLYDSEMKSMRMLMRRGLNRRNIVKFHESFSTMNGEALVFENLGINIQSYIDKGVRGQMMLSDVRTITVQIATALNALKEIRVIHRDIKPDNVMLVDETRPFKVKLIDFGFATSTSLTKYGEILQVPCFRAPEIILGLRYSEAIDMWSVGCTVFYMLTHRLLFRGRTAYDILNQIIETCGQPPNHMLNEGKYTAEYFVKTKKNGWRLKTPKEYWGNNVKDRPRRQFTSLDDLQKEGMNTHEPQQFKQCMELIKAMLKIDQHNRITPCDVLRHPFVTQKNQTKTRASTSVRPLDFNPSAAPLVDLIAQTKVILVQPASPENTMQLKPLDFNPSAAPSVDLITQTKVIMVQPASPENTMQLEPLDLNPSAAPSVDLITPTKVIMVQPASPKNTSQLEDTEREVRLQAEPKKTPEVSKAHPPPPDAGKETKKKKKNCCQRFFAWIRKTFRCNQVGVMGVTCSETS